MMSSVDRNAVEQSIHKELCRSYEVHGDWSDLSLVRMLDVIVDELLEVEAALDVGDLSGDHGVYIELAQVAACCQKMMARLL